MISGWLWLLWIGGVIVTFAVLEGIAIRNKPHGDTLSEYTRRWLGISPRRWHRLLGIPVFTVTAVGFVVWFVPHILLGVWP